MNFSTRCPLSIAHLDGDYVEAIPVMAIMVSERRRNTVWAQISTLSKGFGLVVIPANRRLNSTSCSRNVWVACQFDRSLSTRHAIAQAPSRFFFPSDWISNPKHVQQKHPLMDLCNTSATNVAKVLDFARDVTLCEGYQGPNIDKDVLQEHSLKLLLDQRKFSNATTLALSFPFPFLSAYSKSHGQRIGHVLRAITCTRIASTADSSRCVECGIFADTAASRRKSKSGTSRFPTAEVSHFC